MRYLLDTSSCIYFLNGTYPELTKRVLASGPARLALSSLSVAELRFGAARSAKAEANNARIDRFVAELMTIPFDDLCASHFGRLKARQLAQGNPIPDSDIGIVATALSRNLSVVSADRHMTEIQGITIEDWTDVG